MASRVDFGVPKKRAIFRDLTSTSRMNVQEKKTNSKRIRSIGQLCHRSGGVPPFSAWVEPASCDPRSAPEAVLSARAEEERLNKLIQEKTEKLKEFQLGVRKRVKELERIRKEQQLNKSYEAVEVERNVVLQSSFPKKSSLAKRDTCVYRKSCDLTISHVRGAVVHDHSAMTAASQLLNDHAHHMRQNSRHARQMLSSKSKPVEMDEISQLPGGLWGEVARPNRQEEEPTEQKEADISGDCWIGSDEINDVSVTDVGLHAGSNREKGEQEDQGKTTVKSKSVHFEDDCDNLGIDSQVNHTRRGQHAAIEQLIKPGKVREETKKQCRGQMAMFRRLFMDIEREQVREKIRMKEHRKNMEILKVAKEIQRLEVEHKQMAFLKQQELKAAEQELLKREEQQLHEISLEDKKKVQKSKETVRYVEALRAMLRERLRSKRIVVPPLCSCGPTVWDASPDTCANNCVFYKNPKAYAKALASLLASPDIK